MTQIRLSEDTVTRLIAWHRRKGWVGTKILIGRGRPVQDGRTLESIINDILDDAGVAK